MTLFDTTLLVILAVFVINGLVKGLIRSVGSLVAVIVGVWLALELYGFAYDFLGKLFFGYINLGKAACFLIVYIIVNRLVNFGFSILDSAYDILSAIPFLTTINRLAGAVFGLIEGGIVLGFLLYIGLKYPGLKVQLNDWAKGSRVVPYLTSYAMVFVPLIPNIIDSIKDWLGRFDIGKVYEMGSKIRGK